MASIIAVWMFHVTNGIHDFNELPKFNKSGNLSEWLRRKIRNLLGFARAGSSPAVVVIFSLLLNESIFGTKNMLLRSKDIECNLFF